MTFRQLLSLVAATSAFLLAACGGPVATTRVGGTPPSGSTDTSDFITLNGRHEAEEVVLYAYGLLGTGYQFGGRNPEAGLDCSGMVSYIVEQVSGKRLPHNAAEIAQSTRPIKRRALQPGDLVFFNTLRRAHSHMGVYLGDERFLHAPNSRGSVRIDSLTNRYWSRAFDGARTLLPDG